MVRAVMVAAVLLQCCGVLLAARPLKGDVVAAAGSGGGGGGEMFVMQILKTSTPTTPVGNGCKQGETGGNGAPCHGSG
uniref:Uncharacterized protein n=2 Tax=Oryza TaxID=4527 RepID=A0A0D3FE66_9ORYZ